MQIHLLDDAKGYISGIITNFYEYGYDPLTSAIRFGRTGTGKAPNYKIEEPSYPRTLRVRGLAFELTVTPASTFSGRNHRKMIELDDCERHDRNWMADTMTIADLEGLLSKVGQSEQIH